MVCRRRLKGVVQLRLSSSDLRLGLWTHSQCNTSRAMAWGRGAGHPRPFVLSRGCHESVLCRAADPAAEGGALDGPADSAADQSEQRQEG